eukprot:CAMPEP_0170405658 /NCGR_PEP_ID=MMETSP0117_2-20130122/27299_1 /TAXON_ID=400756 /ORGANISM="Durinskia baltica, Strain CSIRO CS-38" /LENGTH=126 /DNA_ID=CAMNT_0010662789 /DNA_START=123 /DNA_END=501 /DNA_ORIENTATION=-
MRVELSPGALKGAGEASGTVGTFAVVRLSGWHHAEFALGALAGPSPKPSQAYRQATIPGQGREGQVDSQRNRAVGALTVWTKPGCPPCDNELLFCTQAWKEAADDLARPKSAALATRPTRIGISKK